MSNTFVLVGGPEIEVKKDDPDDPDSTYTVNTLGQYSDGKTIRWVGKQEGAVTLAEMADPTFYSDMMDAALTTANT